MAQTTLEDIVSLAKRRGFIYQGSEVYGGLAGTWDYGPLGVQLKRNIMSLWWQHFVEQRDDMYGVDAAILMNKKVWEASGHATGFNDPMTECMNCLNVFRADKLENKKCPICGKTGNFSETQQFNMMFKTVIGPKFFSVEPKKDEYVALKEIPFRNIEDDALGGKYKIDDPRKELTAFNLYNKNALSYLRPETAQGIFTNFKNVVDSIYPDLPFGIAQQGKAFRNEISPRDFVFRSREFEQMEIEYFVYPDKWQEAFEMLIAEIHKYLTKLGLPKESIHEHEIAKEDLAHYSKRTIDFEFDYPIGREELLGIAYRTDFDLQNIQRASGKSMEYIVKGTSAKVVPHVIEPSFGVERLIMAVLASAYKEDEQNGEKRIYLKLNNDIAPVKIAVFPLLKNKPELIKKARGVYETLKKEYGAVVWDDNGNIGKRYRRQDEIGTPYCVTVDFDTLDDDTITVRDRDTTKQERVKITDLASKIKI